MWRESWWGLFSIFLFSVFINISKLAVPLFVMQILDRVISSRSIVTLVMLASITLCAVGAGLLLDIVRQRMFIRWGAWIERRFGPPLFHAGVLGQSRGHAATPSKSLKDLAMLRAFYGNPSLVVLDEPEANLDREARRALGRAIKTLSERGSIVIFTSLSKVPGRSADKVLLFGDSRVKPVEDPEEIAQLGRSKRAD